MSSPKLLNGVRLSIMDSVNKLYKNTIFGLIRMYFDNNGDFIANVNIFVLLGARTFFYKRV
jgi:hypothetical protein